jgi:hypothetical protein
MTLTLEIAPDDALELLVALDTGMTTLACRALEHGMTPREIDHALIYFRRLRAELLRKRSEALSAAIERAKGKS